MALIQEALRWPSFRRPEKAFIYMPFILNTLRWASLAFTSQAPNIPSNSAAYVCTQTLTVQIATMLAHQCLASIQYIQY